jgi:hypothetical protein
MLGADMSLPPEITTRRDDRHGSRLGDVIRRLSSSDDGELIATVYAMRRVLDSVGADIHTLAEHLEKSNGSFSKAEMQKLYDAGYTAGVEAAENKHHGVHDFHSADGKPPWEAVALFLQHNKSRLDAKHHEFVDDMASRTVWGREPTIKQHQYMHSLFYKLGGKLT